MNILQVLALGCALAIFAKTCEAQGFVLQMGQPNATQKDTLIIMTVESSCVRIEFSEDGESAIQIQRNAIWWDLKTAEGKKYLRQLLSEKANRRVEVLAERKRFTPEQVAKLRSAAAIQVARDCRSVQELASSFVEAVANDPTRVMEKLFLPDLMKMSEKIGQQLQAGVDRKNSLFTKVMTNLDK